MTGKPTSRQVAITGVIAFGGKAEEEKLRRKATVLSPSVCKGAVYSMGLGYPPPGILPADESAVSALAVNDWGAVFGATSGKQAHLFWMPKPFLVADIGSIKGVKDVAGSIVIDGGGTAYGAGRGRGDPLFTYNTHSGSFNKYHNSPDKIRMRRPPFKDDGVANLAISWDKNTLAGVGEKTGRIFLLSLKTRRTRTLPRVSGEGEAFSGTLCGGPDNFFYVSGQDGELIRISVEGDAERLGCLLPCRRGKAYLARASSFVVSRTGRIYGGTEDGYLFSFDPGGRDLISHGRANDIPDLHCLAEGADGVIYGMIGRGPDISHLVSYHPARGEWLDLGVFTSYGRYPRTAYQVGAIAAGKDGQIVVGEKDRLGHVFIYHPPVPTQ